MNIIELIYQSTDWSFWLPAFGLLIIATTLGFRWMGEDWIKSAAAAIGIWLGIPVMWWSAIIIIAMRP